MQLSNLTTDNLLSAPSISRTTASKLVCIEASKMSNSFSFKNEVNESNSILIKFDVYFIRQRNIIHEPAKFHCRVQKSVKSIEILIRMLHKLAGYREFPEKNDKINDCL